MILPDFRRLREAGVLGINSRNADYIMPRNARSARPAADNKVQTKELARKAGIPTPELLHVIENHGHITGILEVLKNIQGFVVKPAQGSGGNGILLISEVSEEGFITQSGKVLSGEDFAYHISSIISGIYSLGGREDTAVIEALIHPDPVFNSITYQGVPDVRIVVYRGVPIMAMVRLPTKASDGKANLHRGAIGAGIDIGSGVTKSAVHQSRVVELHPDTGNYVKGMHIPHWDKMLLMAATAMEMTGLGYLGADIVLDRDRGPVLLELNARPGLAIQIANQSGLRSRLDRADGALAGNSLSPDARVALAKELFGAGEL